MIKFLRKLAAMFMAVRSKTNNHVLKKLGKKPEKNKRRVKRA